MLRSIAIALAAFAFAKFEFPLRRTLFTITLVTFMLPMQLAVIPQFIPAGVAPLPMGLALALVHVAESMVWFTAIIFATQFARRWLSSPRSSRIIDRVTGGILIGFGTTLALEARA